MKKKILFALHLAPPITGATMVGEHIQKSKVINSDIEAVVLNVTTSKGLTNETNNTTLRKLFHFFEIQLELIKVLSKGKYDLCYLTLTAKGAGFYKDFITVLWLKFFRVKIIYHFHNKGVAQASKGMLNSMLYKFTFKNTKSILLSPRLNFDIVDFVNEENVFYCANGMPDVKYHRKRNKEFDSESKPCQLLFLSNMMKQKGVLTLLESCKILKDRGVIFECNFVGAWSDITEEYFFKVLKEFNLEEYVFAHGKKYGEEKKDFFEQADIFVFPTFNETFGLVLLEAMQAELPVISTFEGAIPDIIKNGESGLLVNKEDEIALANNIEILINSPDKRHQMGIIGRKRYEETYTLKSFENRLKNILTKVLTEY